MRIILESGLERYAWQVMMEAHRKWEKNHGDTLRDAMGWSFDILNKEDTDEAVKAEVERRLEAEYADDLTVTQSDYIRHGMSAYDVEEMDEDERYQLHLDLTYEYGELLGEITDILPSHFRLYNCPQPCHPPFLSAPFQPWPGSAPIYPLPAPFKD